MRALDIGEVIAKIKPDVIALGYDQSGHGSSKYAHYV